MHRSPVVVFLLSVILSASESSNSPSPFPCEDEELDCTIRASRGNCYGLTGDEAPDKAEDLDLLLGLTTLSVCRKSCREHYLMNPDLLDDGIHKFIELSGGVGDKVTDTFGYEHNICDHKQGFVGMRRIGFLSSNYETKAIKEKLFPTQRQYTELGIKMATVPKGLFGDILEFYKLGKRDSKWTREKCEPSHMACWDVLDDGQECSVKENGNMLIMDLSKELSSQIHKTLLKKAEEWVGVKLIPTVVFGIRRYKRGAWMKDHVDQNDTHIISAIINVNQKVDEPWPLDIFDYHGVHHKIVMKPGDLVWYESANLPHGRVQPFKGKYFDNIFVHFRPFSTGEESINENQNSQSFVKINYEK